MDAQQQIEPIPLVLAEDLHERAEIGRIVSDLLATEAWAHLSGGVSYRQREIQWLLMQKPPSTDSAVYVDAIGEQKGLAAIAEVAAGLVKAGEEAEEELRRKEES